jgi:hypothetical protein
MIRIYRYIQGVRLYCPRCKVLVTPYTVIVNDEEGNTVGIEFECGTTTNHPQIKIAAFERSEIAGKD